MEKGSFASDICDMKTKKVLSANEISQKFSIHPMISHTIRHTIPTSWSCKISSMQESTNAISLEQLREKPAKWAYSKLIEQFEKSLNDKSHTKWEAELVGGRRISWSNIYTRLYSTVVDMTLRWFNYKCIKEFCLQTSFFSCIKSKKLILVQIVTKSKRLDICFGIALEFKRFGGTSCRYLKDVTSHTRYFLLVSSTEMLRSASASIRFSH